MLQEASWILWVFEKLVLVMAVYFVISVVNSMAQSYHRRLDKNVKTAKT